MTKQFICQLASACGWSFDINRQPNPLMLSFWKDEMRINVYWTTMTVSTALQHPKKGKTQLYRKNVDSDTLLKIFECPRTHTGLGYLRKVK